jgi:hypothetical protein
MRLDMMAKTVLSGDIRDEEYSALINSSRKLENSKRLSNSLEERTRQSLRAGYQTEGEKFNTNRALAVAEDLTLNKIFPIFLITIGLIVIIISIFSESDASFPLYLGVLITVVAVIWDVVVVIRSKNDKKESFLRQRFD